MSSNNFPARPRRMQINKAAVIEILKDFDVRHLLVTGALVLLLVLLWTTGVAQTCSELIDMFAKADTARRGELLSVLGTTVLVVFLAAQVLIHGSRFILRRMKDARR